MEKKEFIITTAKEIFLKLLGDTNFAHLFYSSMERTDEINLIGDQFKIIVSKVESAYNPIQ